MSRSERKISHIHEAINQVRPTSNSFDDVQIIHQSISNLNWDDLSLYVKFGELTLSSPLLINAMTGGGGTKTEDINQRLAIVAREKNLAIAVGSQMSALKDEDQKKTYQVIRNENPNGIIFANIGNEASIDQAKQAIEMLEADALQIHINLLQELIMPEGDRNFKDSLKRIECIVKEISIPIIVKEVGFGISKETAQTLKDIGIQYIDVGGFGGTNFAIIENARRDTSLLAFNNWRFITV